MEENSDRIFVDRPCAKKNRESIETLTMKAKGYDARFCGWTPEGKLESRESGKAESVGTIKGAATRLPSQNPLAAVLQEKSFQAFLLQAG